MIKALFTDLSPRKTWLYLLLLTIVVTLTYANHFHNDFHFDDSHTITNNVYVRDIKNVPLFFKDGTTFSSLPQNQSYRPLVSASLAIDYWLGDGYNVFFFHISTFILFLLQGFLMFFIIHRIFSQSVSSGWNFFLAAVATAWYLLHPANAETVNYIIARSDLQSTFFVVLGFALYMFSQISRRYFLYLVPVALGVLAKPPAVMFAPMLFFYILLFEQDGSLTDLFSKTRFRSALNALWRSLPAFVLCAVFYVLVDRLTPKTWESGGNSVYHYLITQPFVIFHYFTTFFLPVDLSADTDWQPLESITDPRFFAGCAFLLTMIVIAFKTSTTARQRPIAFGIIWFFLALVPSSSVVPLSEVMNDHRIYFPYLGLVISVCWFIGLQLMRWNAATEISPDRRKVVTAIAVLIMAGYAYGTFQRNQVWRTEESLWYDVTVKSPRNGRGLMNYGLSQMAKGDYPAAETYFNRALEFYPHYHYLFINMGILKNAMGDKAAAETNFRRAVEEGPNHANSYYYYGKFLNSASRYDEAIRMLKRSLEISASDLKVRTELMLAYQQSGQWAELGQLAQSTLELDPANADAQRYLDASRKQKGPLEMMEEEVRSAPTAEKYLDLSLKYHQAGRYDACIQAAGEALKIRPDYPEAYNNIGSAYNGMKQYSPAMAAFRKALAINPGYQLAKNNLALAVRDSAALAGGTAPTAEDYFNEGLRLYKEKQYEKSIGAYEKAISLQPGYADAYNNLGVVYIEMKAWDKAIEACSKAQRLNPAHRLAAGNLNWAREQKRKSL